MTLSLISTQTAITYLCRAAPGESGWANCTVNDATGELSIQSAWGSWAHRWSPDPAHLGELTLTVFIGSRGDVDYLARKLQGGGRGGQRWAARATARALRQLVAACRLEHGREQLEGRLEPDDFVDGQVLPHLRDRYTAEGLPIFSHREVDAHAWDDPTRKTRLPYLDRDSARRLWEEIGKTAAGSSGVPDHFFEHVLELEGFSDYVTEEPWEHSCTEQTSEDRALREIVLPALIQACRAAQGATSS